MEIGFFNEKVVDEKLSAAINVDQLRRVTALFGIHQIRSRCIMSVVGVYRKGALGNDNTVIGGIGGQGSIGQRPLDVGCMCGKCAGEQ